jgi:hypothetical protein
MPTYMQDTTRYTLTIQWCMYNMTALIIIQDAYSTCIHPRWQHRTIVSRCTYDMIAHDYTVCI